MNNEWKELDINNLPPDILVGDYEFQAFNNVNGIWEDSRSGLKNHINLSKFIEKLIKYRYRKRQPKPPSHEEIMTKWWLDKSGNWERVTGFAPLAKRTNYRLYNSWVSREYFFDLESATIPPEVEERDNG